MPGPSGAEDLAAWGWTEAWALAFADHAAAGRRPGRVVGASPDRVRVRLAGGEVLATLAGRLRHAAQRAADHTALPTVGDWVAVEAGAVEGTYADGPADDGLARIAAVLPRRSAIRRQAGTEQLGQRILAANVDDLLIVQAVGHDANPRRLERYLAMAWSSGARPAVVLNKADLQPDAGPWSGPLREVALGVPVHVVSAVTGAGLDGLRDDLGPGRTVALLGSSGVGKSSLVNALLGTQRQATAEVRPGDERGRHTTVTRELIAAPEGLLLLDTPGLRSLAPWEAEGGLAATFADIDELAAGCRFSDCAHGREPGCAVAAAIAAGTLAAERLASQRKLTRELAAQTRRNDARSRKVERQQWRAIERGLRARERSRERGLA
ncbi:MAG TPA: ribosome small subunit-dependent GTPase A [Candidatus Limnocylindrales bacterium]|nr:ribosome small subunit-dependent GTPase A [Candidatus Limnocylindrales bacterium]